MSKNFHSLFIKRFHLSVFFFLFEPVQNNKSQDNEQNAKHPEGFSETKMNGKKPHKTNRIFWEETEQIVLNYFVSMML